jgi:hypothetical protein
MACTSDLKRTSLENTTLKATKDIALTDSLMITCCFDIRSRSGPVGSKTTERKESNLQKVT